MLHTWRLFGKPLLALIYLAVPLAAHASLQLSELLPDPAGDDNAEWVELVNNAEDDVSTAGWKLVINNRTTLLPARTIAAHQFMVFTKTETKFTLTNSGATVSLLDPASTATSQLSYGQAPTGQSYALNNGTWQWTNKPTPGQENILQVAATPGAAVAPATGSTYRTATTKEVYNLKSGAKVVVEGVITATPEELGSHLAFINGLQLNLTGEGWPELSAGYRVRVTGSISHTASYGTRLNVKTANDIKITSQEIPTEPTVLPLQEVTKEYEGELIQTAGDVTNRGNGWFTLSDGDQNLRVVLRNRELDWPKLSNEHIVISGLVTLSQGEARLWPRSPQDITREKQASIPGATETVDLTQKEPTDWFDYMVLVILAVILATAWWWNKKKLPAPGQLIRTWFSK